MNLASIVPSAATSPAGGSSSRRVPAGFLDVLASKVAAGGDAGAVTTEGSITEEDAAEQSAEGVLTLAALASRTVAATQPLVVPVVTTSGEGTVAGDQNHDVTAAIPAGGATGEAVDVAAAPLVADVEVSPDASELPVDAVPAVTPSDARRLTEVDAATQTDVTAATDVTPTTDLTAAGEVETAQPLVLTDAPDMVATVPTDVVTGGSTSGHVDATEPALRGVAAGPAGERGTETAAAVTADQDAPPRAVPATPADRGRGRAESATSRTRIDGVGGSGVDGTDASPPVQTTRPGSIGRHDPVAPSSAAQRVLDIVTQLEDAPPPRVVVIETGEVRVRLGLDAGTVRMTVLGPLAQAGEEVLREAAQALEAGGFGTEFDRGPDGDGRDGDRAAPDPDARRPSAATTTRPSARSRGGLQL